MDRSALDRQVHARQRGEAAERQREIGDIEEQHSGLGGMLRHGNDNRPVRGNRRLQPTQQGRHGAAKQSNEAFGCHDHHEDHQRGQERCLPLPESIAHALAADVDAESERERERADDWPGQRSEPADDRVDHELERLADDRSAVDHPHLQRALRGEHAGERHHSRRQCEGRNLVPVGRYPRRAGCKFGFPDRLVRAAPSAVHEVPHHVQAHKQHPDANPVETDEIAVRVRRGDEREFSYRAAS